MKKKAVFITNIPSPYRVDFFSYMQKNFPEYEFHIIFSGAGMENRKWSVEMEEIEHYHFLKSKTIIIRKRFGLCHGVQPDDPSCGTLVPEKEDAVYQLDGRHFKFREKYRKSTALIEKLYYKKSGGIYREQHCIA